MEWHAIMRQAEPGLEAWSACDLEHSLLAPAQICRIARQRYPPVRADASGEDGPDVLGDEAGDHRRLCDARLHRAGTETVAVLEDDGASIAKPEQGLGVVGDRSADVGGVAARLILRDAPRLGGAPS